ncbi:hypothetical protein AX769_21255 (plasmid) [Frondihabitans sp. PAMC 28766]|nr:hypothetical protein AX769_21255 [Frondihabitans sp. PAMC 28766]
MREASLVASSEPFPASVEPFSVVVCLLETAGFVDDQLHSQLPEGRDALEGAGSAERSSECVPILSA